MAKNNPKEQVLKLIDDLGESMTKQEWIDFCSELELDISIRREASEQELANEQEEDDDNDD